MSDCSALFAPLQQGLARLEQERLRRRHRVVDSATGRFALVEGRQLLNFCANDYLGLATAPALAGAAQVALSRYGSGSGASHLVCGHLRPHQTLAERLAQFLGLPAALTFATGYLANLAVPTALLGRGDAVFADRLNHASLNDGCLLSRADFVRYPHNDLDALARRLEASSARVRLIAVDAVFSMDGDLAPLDRLLALAERYDAWLYLDDAHGFGVLGQGRGSLAHWGIASPRIIYMATLGKAAGSAGAVVAGDPVLIEWLQNRARSYIYTTAAPPAVAATTLAALDLIEADSWRREQLRQHIERLRSGLAGTCYRLMDSTTPIQPILLPDNATALALAEALFERGLWVAAIRPPTVPTPRLRITLSAAHEAADIDRLLEALKDLQ
ncbi:8-amino-7-oxononanoate synthase [Chitinimonas lacunae]|uniref:8-amino-7-oxononanoate synthase n=1 Tax=Chitinimonas lacunae TaxID=1963018 RepID=A0ABV8MRW7_9NEIS